MQVMIITYVKDFFLVALWWLCASDNHLPISWVWVRLRFFLKMLSIYRSTLIVVRNLLISFHNMIFWFGQMRLRKSCRFEVGIQLPCGPSRHRAWVHWIYQTVKSINQTNQPNQSSKINQWIKAIHPINQINETHQRIKSSIKSIESNQ